MNINQQFAERVAELRGAQSLTIEQAAAGCSLSLEEWRSLEAGAWPDERQLCELATALGVDVSDLIEVVPDQLRVAIMSGGDIVREVSFDDPRDAYCREFNEMNAGSGLRAEIIEARK